jgi:hypothetical protein
MNDLRIILHGHGYNVLQYIKCLIEQSKKDEKVYSIQWILYGVVVVGHVYTMLLYQSRSIERAKTGSMRAIGLYIEFITQLSMIDISSSSGVYTPYTIGCKDAAQFVYKKIFPDIIHHDYIHTDLTSSNTTKEGVIDDILSQSAIDSHLEILHEYKQIIQNMVNVLFSKDVIHNSSNLDFTIAYYNDALSILIHLNNVLEQSPINMLSYRNIISQQCDNHMSGAHTEKMSPNEYSRWMIANAIYP